MDNIRLTGHALAEMPKDSRFRPKQQPRVIEILAYPRVQLLDVAGPLQVFASANELAARHGEAPLYAPRVVSAGAPVVTASAGLELVAAPLPRVRAALDTRLTNCATTPFDRGVLAPLAVRVGIWQRQLRRSSQRRD